MVESRSMVRGAAAGPAPLPPGAGEEAAADGVELARVTEGKRAQEGAERGGRAQLSAEHGRGGTGAQARRVVDAVAAGERGVDEGECLEAGARGAGGSAELHVLVDELLEAQLRGQGGGQQQAGVGHRVTIREGY